MSYGHLKVENKGKHRLANNKIRFKPSCKKSKIEPKVQILLNTCLVIYLMCLYNVYKIVFYIEIGHFLEKSQ